MLNRPLALASGLAAASLVVADPTASATVVVAKTVDEMAREASTVVRAVVRARQSAWDEAHRRIHTYTELEVLDAWVGAPRGSLVVRTLGGEVGSVGMKVSGTARFAEGEEVVLFLRPDPLDAAHHQVIGLSQGKFRVEPGPEGPVAIPDTHDLALATRDAAGAVAIGSGGSAAPRAVGLADLQAQVRAARETAPTSEESGSRLAPVPDPQPSSDGVRPPASTRPPASPRPAPGPEATDR